MPKITEQKNKYDLKKFQLKARVTRPLNYSRK